MSNQDDNAIPAFNDAAGREYTIKLTYGLIEKVLRETKIDLLPTNWDYMPLCEITRDHRRLGTLLWACVSGQHQGVERTAFMDSLDGPTLCAGWEAVVAAIGFFIQSSSRTGNEQAKRYEKIVERGVEVVAAEDLAAMETLASQQTTDGLKEAIEKLKIALQDQMNEALDKFSSKPPES